MNLSIIDSSEDVKSKELRTHFGEAAHFSSPMKTQRTNSSSFNDTYSSSQMSQYHSDSYSNSLYDDEQGDHLLKSDIDSDHTENIFTKLINKTTLLKLQNTIEDDMESLVRERDSDTDKSQSNTLVVMSHTKSSDINESTALLETPSSYSSFQSSQLNQDEEDRSIPKTGFEFLDNW